nr:isoform 2 of protein vacuoleless1 [Quercus suber]
MANVSVAAEWQLLGDRYYRKPELYHPMQWRHIDLSRNKVACAPFGGPVALIRDDSKIVQLYSESALRKLRLFNSAGVSLSDVVWKNPGGRLIGMSWSDDHTLVCIVQDGTVYRYNVHAELIEPNLSILGHDYFDENVVECVFWGNGVVCVTETCKIFAVPDFKTGTVVRLADPPPPPIELELERELPHCVAVIEPQYTLSGNVEVLLAIGDGVVMVEEDEVQALPVPPGDGPLQKMVVSGNGRFVAAFTHDGRLAVYSTRFEKMFEYQCESALPPEQLAWRSAKADENLRLIRSSLPEAVEACVDAAGHEFDVSRQRTLLRAASYGQAFCRHFSLSSLLYDALDHFDRRSAKADENLRLIRSSLPEAVEACVDAAGHEFDVSRQRTLLRAASYGQAFCSNFQRDRIQEMCKTLRVLNAVRNPEIGIPLSIQQYKLLTPPVLIGRLINAHRHLLALRISEYLGMNQEVVIMHWACSKITASLAIPDAALLEILLDKLRLCKGISYAAVSAHADKNGRRKLAAMLIEHEPRSSKQVPLLLSIGEEDTALMKATESGDTDLVYLVLFHIWQKKQPLEFFGMIQARILARDLFITYAR